MKSMTAFGRASCVTDGYEVTAELKSVNNRYLDWNIRLPKLYFCVEERIKSYLQSTGIVRGKVDVFITVTAAVSAAGGRETGVRMVPDLVCAESYVAAAKALQDAFGFSEGLTLERLMALPGVMVKAEEETEKEDDDALWNRLQPALAAAAEQFLAAREKEGARLEADVRAKLADIRVMKQEIAGMTAEIISGYRRHFEERLRAAMGDGNVTPDENRVLTECAIYADRVAIDEELVRLESHFAALDELFAAKEPVGRRIDFMLQETNREVNTIGSKCSDAGIARVVVNMKSEFEKIREQIQNVE